MPCGCRLRICFFKGLTIVTYLRQLKPDKLMFSGDYQMSSPCHSRKCPIGNLVMEVLQNHIPDKDFGNDREFCKDPIIYI